MRFSQLPSAFVLTMMVACGSQSQDVGAPEKKAQQPSSNSSSDSNTTNGGTSSTGSGSSAAFDAQIQGSWSEGCITSTDPNNSSSQYYSRSVNTISNGTMKGVYDEFAAAGCTSPTLKMDLSGTYKIGAELAAQTYEYDSVVNTMSITLLTDDLVSSYNTNKACGFTNWVKGQAMNIPKDNADCGTSLGSIYYSAIRLQAGKLQFTEGTGSDPSEGLSADKRVKTNWGQPVSKI